MSEILNRLQDPTIKELKHKIKVNEKSRRKMQQSLMKEILQLTSQLQQKENIIKEVREYIETQMPIVKAEIGIANINTSTSELLNYEKILQILDKVGDEK